MRAMILAAGLGTRLRPLTLARPKVLVPVMGTPILDFWINRLYSEGVEAVVVNAFHLAERLVEELRRKKWPIPVEVRTEPILLDTGGGIRNALDFFGREPFIVINGDIVCDAPLAELYRLHLASGSPVSLLMHDCPEFNNVAVGKDGLVLGFGKKAPEICRQFPGSRLMAFTGIHFTSASVISRLSPGRPESIIPLYSRLIAELTPPQALFHQKFFWREMGSIARYQDLSRELSQLPPNFLDPLKTGCKLCIHPEARVEPGVRMEGFVTIGAGCRIMEGAQLTDSILWNGVQVGPGSSLDRCIASDNVIIQGTYQDKVLVEVNE